MALSQQQQQNDVKQSDSASLLNDPETPLSKIVVPRGALKRGPLVTRTGYNLTVEDRLEITSMPARFDWAFCSNNLEALAACVTDDIEIEHVLGGHVQGKSKMADLKVPFFGLRHQLTNQLLFINVDGDPSLLSFLNAPQVVSETPVDTNVSLPAIYASCIATDTFRLGDDGHWRFCHRVFDQLKLADYLHVEPSKAKQLASTIGKV